MASPAPGPTSLSPARGPAGGRWPARSLAGDPQTVPTHLVPVGPAPVSHRSARSAQQDDVEVFGYPVQIGKIQPPLLPEETLRRDRLLDWLHAKTRSRLALIVADAGYGKTTLLADWSRRTRVRTLWYRLDEHDRDWAVFIHHIVAAGREIDPAFAPNTQGLLRELAANLGSRGAIVQTLLAELRAWAVVGSALILDDYQQVDDVPEIREIVRELVVRGPDRLAVVIASRTRPTLPLARLRAIGEAAEIGTDDLRFDRDETERLFRDTYHDPLERDLLDDLARTTEGWAATLRLVESVVRGRPRDEVRAAIRSLSGREGDLHDYLAEEVVGRMPRPAQDFVERCCLLAVVTPELAAAAAGVTPEAARGFLDAAELAGLLSRRGRTGQAGRPFHPLVRTFLEGRLHEAIGVLEIRQIHARIALAAEPASWSVAAYHYAAADLADDAVRVLSASVPVILGSGAYKDAEQLASRLDPARLGAWHDVIVAHRMIRNGDTSGATASAECAFARVQAGDVSVAPEVTLATLMNVAYGAAAYDRAVRWASDLVQIAPASESATLADVVIQMASTFTDGDLESISAHLREVSRSMEERGQPHYAGIVLLDLAWVSRARGDAQGAGEAGRAALALLQASSSGTEITAVRAVTAWSHAHLGDWAEARRLLDATLAEQDGPTRFESLVEAADIIGSYNDPGRCAALLEDLRLIDPPTEGFGYYADLVVAENCVRLGQAQRGLLLLRTIPSGVLTGYPGFHVRRLLSLGFAEWGAAGRVDPGVTNAAADLARKQRAGSTLAAATLLKSIDSPNVSDVVLMVHRRDAALISVYAEALLTRLADLTIDALEALSAEAARRPARWRASLRRALSDRDSATKAAAARLMELIGERPDIASLRRLSRELKGEHRNPELGRALARRVAPRAFVEDLGRIELKIGDRPLPGTSIRRKALALLTFLLAQPRMSATRDQVLDALWPDQDPGQAANSLHQTVYFLRRVFEPAYSDDLSPGYLHHDPDVLWLDPELIDSRSQLVRRLIATMGPRLTPGDADQLSELYVGRFALDFAYEEWAVPVREHLHARYLEIIERAIYSDSDSGRVDRAIRLAQHALEVDPELDEVERTVIKLYRLAGAHAAAAEQYEHYEAVQRDLGLDAPPIEDL
jgi:DNA-binding SARP family transcriptional activator